MATEDIKWLVIRYSIPTIIGMLVNALYNVVDRFFIGKIEGIGAMALTGVGLTMPIMNILMGLAQLVGIGAATRISIAMGKKDKDEAENILGNALVMITGVTVLVTVFGLIFARPILQLFGASPQTIGFASEYIEIIIGFSCFNMISFALNHCIRATGNPKRFASAQLIGGISNIILDPIFIFAFDMGVRGAAIATVLSQAIACVWIISFYFTEKSALKFHRKNLRLRPAIMISIVSIGLSPFLMQVANSLVSTVANRTLLSYGGDIAVGAMTVIQSISTLFFMPILGINQGVQPIQGFNFGAKQFGRVRQSYWWSVLYSTIISVTGFVIVQFFAEGLVTSFNTDPELIRVGAYGMRVFLFNLLFIGFIIPTTNFFQSIGRATTSIFLTAMRQVVLVGLYIGLPLIWGLEGVWLAGPGSDAVAVVVIAFFIVRQMRRLRGMEREQLELQAQEAPTT